MSILSWNCQGLGPPLTGRNLKFLNNKYRPSLVFLMETRVKKEKVERWKRRLNFQNEWYEEAVGQGGGLAVWWNDSDQIQVISSNKNMIHLKIDKGMGMDGGFLTLVYGPPKEKERAKWWEQLQRLDPGEQCPWLCCGDFNDLLYNFEKKGGRARSLMSLVDFQNFMLKCNMEDLGAKGMEFTWANQRMETAHIKERLDRAVCNTKWRESHQCAQVCNLEPIGSDHSPLIIHFQYSTLRRSKEFKFELNWIDHEEFDDLVSRTWEKYNVDLEHKGEVEGLKSNLNKMKETLTKWSKKEFPNNNKLLLSLMSEFKEC